MVSFFKPIKTKTMKHLFLILALILTISASLPKKREVHESSLHQHWKMEIGFTSYRTIPAVVDQKIYIGSNGNHFRDYALDDGNGVFLLHAASGKIAATFANEQFGDMDVNGILRLKDAIFFGNDNDEFICTDKLGKIKWRVYTSGDVEHRPVSIQSEGQELVVFATETGQLQALNAKTGKEIWTYYYKDFDAWKPGDNRTLFKVKMHFTEGNIFFNEPSLSDLNGDGVKDLVYNTNWGDFTAINGKTGNLLWDLDGNDLADYYLNMGREKPLIIGEGVKSQVLLLIREKEEYTKQAIAIFNSKGKLIKIMPTEVPLGETMLSQTDGFIITNTAIIHPETNSEDLKIVPIEDAQFLNEDGVLTSCYSGGQVAQKKVYYNGETCALIVYQYELKSHSGQSPLLLVGLNSGKVHFKTYLPDRSEFTPYISDFNQDGKLDVLIGCYDKYLYCFDLDIPSILLID